MFTHRNFFANPTVIPAIFTIFVFTKTRSA